MIEFHFTFYVIIIIFAKFRSVARIIFEEFAKASDGGVRVRKEENIASERSEIILNIFVVTEEKDERGESGGADENVGGDEEIGENRNRADENRGEADGEIVFVTFFRVGILPAVDLLIEVDF